MPRMYRKYTKEFLAPVVASSISYAECLSKLGLRISGGNYKHLQSNIDKFNLDCSHMLHQASNQGKEFKDFDSLHNNRSIKKRLINEYGNTCQKCSLSVWNDLPITLELEHIDGNNRNNFKENLLLLCPNCHSQTFTWRNRKR